MSRSHKTAKGTELPLLNLRGKDYLTVPFRIVWFHEEHPDWSIETDIVDRTDNSCLSKATIRNETGRIMATAYKFEDQKGFADFIEKSGTGAVGRALAYIGYGTQFCADELAEGERLADAPIDSGRGETAQDLVNKAQPPPAPWDLPKCSRCGKQMKLAASGLSFYCPDFKNKSKGEHPTVKA